MTDDVRPYEVDASEILKPTMSERIAELEAIVDTLNRRLLTAEVTITKLETEVLCLKRREAKR